MIKEGQVYEEVGFPKYIITLVEESSFKELDRVHFICKNGEVMTASRKYFESQLRETNKEIKPILIAEYPTWQEAINSEEFK